MFTATDLIETTDLTLTTDCSNTGTSQRIFLIKADGKNLSVGIVEDLCE